MKIAGFIIGIVFCTSALYGQNKTIIKPSAATIEAGKQLISKSDCVACHRADVKLLGPSYIEVAKKYPATEANYQLLTKKVIEGGSGNWGQIPMSPHASLAPADARKMVQYILSVKPVVK